MAILTSSPRTSEAGENAAKSISESGTVRRARIILCLLFLATIGLAINSQSLWIDEGYTAWFACHQSIASFFSALIGSPGAPGDPQMIFYLLYMWIWVKIFGFSEVALRASNVPFAALLIVSVSWASRHLLRRPALAIFFCLSPFFWFYLNDARPYVALMALSSVASVALLTYVMSPTKHRLLAPWCCLIALFLAWGTHILAAFLLPSMVVFAAAALRGNPNLRHSFLRDWYRPAIWCAPAFLALATFYVWVSSNGVNRGFRNPGPSNFVYVLYEFLGFGGLGPPRNEIRAAAGVLVFVPYWPWLLLGAVALLGLAFFIFRARPSKMVGCLAAGLLVSAAFALGISKLENFQVLGRHMAALFPLFLIIPMMWLEPSLSSTRVRHRAITALVVVGAIWMMSDGRLRFVGKYGKDSYREASSKAVARSRLDGGKILWAADPHVAHYYGILVLRGQNTVEIGDDADLDWPVQVQAIDAQNWSSGEVKAYLDAATTPTILVLSKADLFDTKGGWQDVIQQQRPTELARLIAFRVYEWLPNPTISAPPGKKPDLPRS
jgi:hypothetical protein